jgi:hypothetical protein
VHAANVAADLEQYRILRNYLIFKAKVRVPDDDLSKAIDDYVEKLTGDRTKLHASHDTIGPKRGARMREMQPALSCPTTPPKG